jgi:septum formation protein
MLKSLGLTFDTIPSDFDENTDLTDPVEVVHHLSRSKAESIAKKIKESEAKSTQRTLIIGSDTIVVLGNEVLGKPLTREHAYQMLMRMSGRHHRVYTGVALVDADTGEATVKHQVTSVFFRSLDPAEVRYYAKTEEPMDKAGAYALQGTAAAFVEKIDGCSSTVVGLPMPLTVQMLRAAGVRVLGMP